MKLYTLGYQSLSAPLYLQSLVNAGVGIVIDVRENAWSQRPDFIKSNLGRALATVNIDYRHLKSAGNPSSNRKNARNARECLRRYRRHLRAHDDCLAELLTLVREADSRGRPACLTCYERDTANCHRAILIEELRVLAPELTTFHLQPTLPIQPNTFKPVRSLMSDAFLAPSLLPFT
jgi:uncharacterized protein (DUF488 family)